MKKLFVFIVAVMYLTQASGMGVHLHYCMDKLVSWGLTEAKKCPPCNKKKDPKAHFTCKDCCRDEHQTAKLDGALKAGQAFDLKPFTLQAEHQAFPFPETSLIVPVRIIGGNNINAPPHKYKVPVFLFNSVFRI